MSIEESEPDNATSPHGFQSWSKKKLNSLWETWRQIDDADKYNERYPREAIPKPRHVQSMAYPQGLVKSLTFDPTSEFSRAAPNLGTSPPPLVRNNSHITSPRTSTSRGDEPTTDCPSPASSRSRLTDSESTETQLLSFFDKREEIEAFLRSYHFSPRTPLQRRPTLHLRSASDVPVQSAEVFSPDGFPVADGYRATSTWSPPPRVTAQPRVLVPVPNSKENKPNDSEANLAGMSALRTPDVSLTKQKALDDARLMQAAVDNECATSGKERPPYILSELIGKGSFGRVYKATALQTNQLVAVKIIDIEEGDTLDPKRADTYSEFLKEINTLKLLRESSARNINHVIEALPVGQTMWMVTEYCAGGSVQTLMKPTAPGGLYEKWIIPILREVAVAIHWVHKQGVIHRDIKCANVLVHEGGTVQLCDFGVSGLVEHKFDKRSTFIGTLHWMAPELFAATPSYSIGVDIWAFGSMMYEIASGLPPNVQAGMDVSRVGNSVKQHAPRLDGDQYSDELKSLIAFCLVEDPAARPTIEEVQQHPYIRDSEAKYPTSSLTKLVTAYRIWEAQGGSRKSLFAFGGALASSDLSSTSLATDEWNFSTTAAFDLQVFTNSDSQAVFDVYGSQVDFNAEALETSRPQKPKPRRRPPPHLPVMIAPLEKVFDPNTITNYEENARAYYGKPIPPPASDLPLRDDSNQPGDVRESLIDLDASLHGSELGRFVDMETIRAGASRASIDYDLSSAQDFVKPPLSDPEQFNNNRRTQDWKFPIMPPPASANPEMSRFPFNEERSAPSSGRPSMHQHFDSVGSGYGSELPVPRVSNQANRVSSGSLIDLDMGLADTVVESARPSTANSDVGSITGSDIGGANPFELERHASLYVPFSNREPSIYVSDDSEYARSLAEFSMPDEGRGPMAPREGRRGYHSVNPSYSSTEYSDNGEYLTPKVAARPPVTVAPRPLTTKALAFAPPPPPSERVMQGQSSTSEVKDEFRRLIMNFGEHLSIANRHINSLPVTKGGSRADSNRLSEEEL